MVKLKNTTKGALSLLRPAGPDAHVVKAGDTVQVPGKVTKTTDDAVIVGEGDRARAYSRKLWELVEEPQHQTPQIPPAAPQESEKKKKEGERP